MVDGRSIAAVAWGCQGLQVRLGLTDGINACFGVPTTGSDGAGEVRLCDGLRMFAASVD
jgi:hypothetical protein